jgi:hypothetical protein
VGGQRLEPAQEGRLGSGTWRNRCHRLRSSRAGPGSSNKNRAFGPVSGQAGRIKSGRSQLIAHRKVCEPKADVFSGRQTHRDKSQRSRSLDGRVEGNRTPGAHRRNHRTDGSELPGRNESECRGSPESAKPRRPSVYFSREGSRVRRSLADAATPLRRGVSDGTVTRTHQANGETLLVPSRNRRSQVGRITGVPGKAADDERVADGPARARRRGNARGAMGPCCSAMPPTTWKAGVS